MLRVKCLRGLRFRLQGLFSLLLSKDEARIAGKLRGSGFGKLGYVDACIFRFLDVLLPSSVQPVGNLAK